MLVVWFVVQRLSNSPWSRQVRCIRENPTAAEALGINVNLRRLQVFVCGGAIAGVSGAVLVQYIGAWSPGSWSISETFVFFTCIVIGGVGNNFGAAFGTVLILTVVINGVQYLPIFSYTTAAEALQLVVLGVLIVVFLWARPQGIFPERKHRFGSVPPHSPKVTVAPRGAPQVEIKR
jgi:branched-chain amino acid transport system permease protein